MSDAGASTFVMREPGPDLERGERTFVARRSVDVEVARAQHGRLRACLEGLGARVRTLPPTPGRPDAVFMEDVALVLPELVVECRPGAASRREEPADVRSALRDLVPAPRPRTRIDAPGTLEGGDVVLVGRTLLVGLSSRTNARGVRALAALVRPVGYRVETVRVSGALHLKTACTHVGEGLLLANRAWLESDDLDALAEGPDVTGVLPAAEDEPWAANTLLVGKAVVMAAGSPATARRLREEGREVETVAISEFLKAEAGVSCLVLRIR